MPEATIVFESGRVVRVHVTNVRFDMGADFRGGPDGFTSNLTSGLQTVELSGVVAGNFEDFATSELVTPTRSTSRVERSRAALFEPLTRLPGEEPRPRPPKKPKPQSAWDRLLGPDLLEESA